MLRVVVGHVLVVRGLLWATAPGTVAAAADMVVVANVFDQGQEQHVYPAYLARAGCSRGITTSRVSLFYFSHLHARSGPFKRLLSCSFVSLFLFRNFGCLWRLTSRLLHSVGLV